MTDSSKLWVLKECKDKGVEFIRMWFTDILGIMKSFAINVEELEGALKEGMGFDGSSITGYQDIQESDMIAMPDPSTFTLLPWRPMEKRVAKMFCDVLTPDGAPYAGDPRYILKRQLKKAADKGYTFYVGPELSISTSETPHPPRCWTLAATSTSLRWMLPPRCGATPYWCSRRWELGSSTLITRLPRASTRSTCGTPMPSLWPTPR